MKRIFLIICAFSLSLVNLFAQNADSVLDLSILSHKIGDPIFCFQKVEIGIPLPEDIRQKVDYFVKGTADPSKQLNPYLEWELRVVAEFVNLKNPTETITIDGFYMKEFASWMLDSLPQPKNGDDYTREEYAKIGGYREIESPYDFRIRFAPPSVGDWKVLVKIFPKGDEVISFPEMIFSTEQGYNDGNIHVSSNQRFLAKGGQTFYPLGGNLPWPETDTVSDPKLYNYLCYTDKGINKYYRSNEGYRSNYAVPRVYENYKNTMSQLADNGANYLRTIMYPTATEIEWEDLGNYTKRLHMAQEMDDILSHAEEVGIYLQWDLQTHFSFQFSEKAYYRTWAWDSKMNDQIFAYRKLIDSDDPVMFLQNEEAKKYYKQRLRYIIARWGYSTNIAAWELFCEITNVGSPKADNNDFYMQGDNYKIYRDWQIEMANYIKSMYYGKVHLVTASFGGPKNWKDDTFHDPAFDIMTSNIYDFGAPDFSSFWNNSVSKHYLHDVEDQKAFFESYTTQSNRFGTDTYQIRKPMIYSETDPIEAMCDATIIEVRRFLYQSLFSGLAGSLSWDLRFHPKYYSTLKVMSNLVEKMELDTQSWHPGAIENRNGNWTYSSDMAEKMNPKKRFKGLSGQKTSLSDVAFLRSADRNFAIGVVSNKTVNVKTVSDCYPTNAWPADYESLNQQEIVSLKTDGPLIPGMNRGKYDFQYFLLSDLNTPVGISSDRGPDLSMDFSLQANDSDFVIVFLANKKNYDWKEKRKLSRDEIKLTRTK
jgi:hypothetical protein